MTDRGDFAEILDEYLRALEVGNPPDREGLLARHPDLAEELQAALLGIDLVHGAASRLAPEEQADALPGGLLGDYRLLREAVLRTLERYGAVTRTRGGAPLPCSFAEENT